MCSKMIISINLRQFPQRQVPFVRGMSRNFKRPFSIASVGLLKTKDRDNVNSQDMTITTNSSSSYNLLDVRKLTPAIGAEIRLKKEAQPNSTQNPSPFACLDDKFQKEVDEEIYKAIIEHQVIFYRPEKEGVNYSNIVNTGIWNHSSMLPDFQMTPRMQLRFAKSLGDVEPGPHPVYPSVKEFGKHFDAITEFVNDENNPPDTDTWHTDVTFSQNPPVFSVLNAREVPTVGGDTLWSSQIAAYEALSAGMKMDLENVKAVHDFGSFRNNFVENEKSAIGADDSTQSTDTSNFTDDYASEKLRSGYSKFGNAIHPIVKTHPVSGRKMLFINPGFTNHIVGLNSIESQKLLNFLFDHSQKPEFQVRTSWQPGQVAIWDNRSTMHYAIGDYLPARRVMRRVTVLTDRRCVEK